MPLKMSSNSVAKMSSVVSVDWSDITNRPEINDATIIGGPIIIYADGQSNISLKKAYAWTPNPRAAIWNNPQDAVGPGTEFTAIDPTMIGIAEKLASDVADANPTRLVYLIKNGYTGQAISHWLSGTGAPDMYANGVANLTAALTAIGATQINFYFRWQGEADQIGSVNTSYIANFTTMMSRYWTNSFFPAETPALISSISDSATSGSANADLMNDMLQAVVNSDPDKRRFLYVPSLSGTTYWDNTNPGHMTGHGYFSAGAMGASALLNGPGRNTVAKIITDPATGRLIFGNPATSTANMVANYNASGIVLPSTAAVLDIVQQDGGFTFDMRTSFGASAGYVGRASGGTFSAQTALTVDSLIVFFGAQGYDGSAWTGGNVGNFKFNAAENWNSGAHGTYVLVSNTKIGTLTQVDCLRIDYGSITIYGATSGGLKIAAPAVAGSSVITLPAGTTDFTATGGAGQFVKQNSAGAAFTVAQVGVADVSGFGSGVATFLATPSSANLRAALTDETGTGAAYFVGGALGTPSSVTLTNGTGLPLSGGGVTGTLQAAQFPALTGDATTSAGSLAATVTKINGVDQTTAWSTYTPTVVSSAGAFTTVSATGRYKQLGKTIFVEANVTITTAGTAAGGLQVSLPLTAAAFEYVGNAIEIAVTAKSGAARIPASGTTMNAFDASGTTFIASGRQVTMSAVYEIP